MSPTERVHLTPRQRQLLAPQVEVIRQLRQQAVNLQERLEAENARLNREVELAYPAFANGCRFIAAEGVIEIPARDPIAELDADSASGNNLPTNSEGSE